MLAPDTTGSVDQRAWDGYKTAADSVSQQVMANPTARTSAVPCTPSGDGAAALSSSSTRSGQRAFRRPLTAEETTRFTTLYTNRATSDGHRHVRRSRSAHPPVVPDVAVVPHASRRSAERPTRTTSFALNSYEIASRLSYMFWSSMPDEALFDGRRGEPAVDAGANPRPRRSAC